RGAVMALSPFAREHLAAAVRTWTVPRAIGKVIEIAGTIVQIEMSGASLGDIVEIECTTGGVMCEVGGVRGPVLLAIPLQLAGRIAPGATVRHCGAMAALPVGDALIGRLIDPFGGPLDGGLPVACAARVPIDGRALPIEQRGEVDQRF